MALTQAQYTALKADIIADPAFNSVPDNSDGDFAIAQAYNLEANPAFVVWKTDIPTSEAKQAMSWVEYIGRSDGERDAWQFMLSNGTINAGDVNVRQGIQDVFNGPNGVDSRTALIAIAKRNASRAEKLFSTGTGSDAVPATMSHQGNLSYQDVGIARRNT